nr:hypothetical protein [Enterobacter asburiae]MDV0993363.1 hypothetical protein [Enterobacter asburiae]MDV1004624.1 hypothetical protein [Enterobacter asburiae]
MENNVLTLVLKNDWVASSSGNTYTGKYTVGRLHLTDAFIVVYMKLIHGIEIPDLWVSRSFTKEGANKQVISSQADSLIKISRIWADF